VLAWAAGAGRSATPAVTSAKALAMAVQWDRENRFIT
jgi:hypothetical protein